MIHPEVSLVKVILIHQNIRTNCWLIHEQALFRIFLTLNVIFWFLVIFVVISWAITQNLLSSVSKVSRFKLSNYERQPIFHFISLFLNVVAYK